MSLPYHISNTIENCNILVYFGVKWSNDLCQRMNRFFDFLSDYGQCLIIWCLQFDSIFLIFFHSFDTFILFLEFRKNKNEQCHLVNILFKIQFDTFTKNFKALYFIFFFFLHIFAYPLQLFCFFFVDKIYDANNYEFSFRLDWLKLESLLILSIRLNYFT